MLEEADLFSDLDQLRSRYEVLRQLGRDGECTIYAVRGHGSDRHFLVKVMPNPAGRSRRSRFLNVWQGHTVHGVEHPSLMTIHAVHHLQGGAVAVAMERRRGQTLAERIRSEGALPFDEASTLVSLS